MLIPKIEDGNNFGVGVQEDALAELRQVEAECALSTFDCDIDAHSGFDG